MSSRLGSSQCSPPFFPHHGRGFHQPGERFLSYLGFGLLKRARTLSWNPNGVTFSHSVTHIYADLQARSITVSAPTEECHDLKGMFLLCVITFFFFFYVDSVAFSHVCARKQDSQEWTWIEKRKASTSSPSRLIPSTSQLFSITFKLLFTRSQRVGLRVWLSPPRFLFFLFFSVFKNTFQYYLSVVRAAVQSICYCQSVYVWLFCFLTNLCTWFHLTVRH